MDTILKGSATCSEIEYSVVRNKIYFDHIDRNVFLRKCFNASCSMLLETMY